MVFDWEVVTPSLWTGAAGVIVGMLIISYGFGFMSPNTAEKLAITSSEKAVIAVLASACADKFHALSDVATRPRPSWQTRTAPTKCGRHSRKP